MLKSWFILSSSVVPLVMSATYEVIASETSASFARTTVYNVHCDGEPLSWRDVLKRWSVKDSSFLKAFTTALKRSSYADYYWECIPLNAATADNTFEFVLSDAGGSLCEDTASTSFFADKLYSPSYANLSVINFLNLGGDASLVVPKEDPQVDTNMCAPNQLLCTAHPPGPVKITSSYYLQHERALQCPFEHFTGIMCVW